MRRLRVPVAVLLTLSLPNLAIAQAPADELTEDQKAEKAKGLYVEMQWQLP